MTGGISKQELLERERAEGPDGVIEFLVDQNFNEDIVDGLTRRDANLRLIRVRDVGFGGSHPPDDPGMGYDARPGLADARSSNDPLPTLTRGWLRACQCPVFSWSITSCR